MEDRLHVLGIRHHGPGSAVSVEHALDKLNPEVILIEGPADASDLIKFAGTSGMRPPVALLVYPKGYPEAARFFPYAEFSPEWCAMLWATKHQRAVEFIDLPTQASVVDQIEKSRAERDRAELSPDEIDEADEADEFEETHADIGDDDTPESLVVATSFVTDPLSALAEIAGHSDGESWWNAMVEQSVQSPDVFAAICSVMAELREQMEVADNATNNERDNQREAHMRLRIREALKKHEGEVAVVCGAWHAPALQKLTGYTIKEDKETLKSTKAAPCHHCWIPWTDQRLGFASGYQAGVVSPGWYRHLWAQHKTSSSEPVDTSLDTARWQSRVAALLREEGYDASTASVIEASRLTRSLTAVRRLSAPGLTEMQDASLAALCHGEPAPLQIINSKLVIGNTVGAVDESVPQPPLLIDLAHQQKKLRLKPEALGREIKLDLRSVSGMAKSELLHRLTLLNVDWGVLTDGQAGRGTFREIWLIQWQPEHSVTLAEAVVYGPTVELAAAAFAVAQAEELENSEALANLIQQCLFANLPDAVGLAIRRLQEIAVTSSEATSLMSVLPPLADILRYGTAREMPITELRTLINGIAVEVFSSFRYTCQQLDDEAAAQMRNLTRRFDQAIELINVEYLSAGWQTCLAQVVEDGRAAAIVKGLAARLLHNKQIVAVEKTAKTLSRNLAPAVPVLDAGAWLEGFIDESGEVFLHDDELFFIVDAWLQDAPEESFIEILPMMRRSFSKFDAVLRRRLMQSLNRTPSSTRRVAGEREESDTGPGVAAFHATLPLLNQLLRLPE